jgi:hypothetical protein
VGAGAPDSRSLAAAVEERLLIPAYASSVSPLAVLAHRVLSAPLQLRGRARLRTLTCDGRALRVLEIGRAKVTEAICRPLLGELPEPHAMGWRRTLTPATLGGGADLVVAEVHRWLAPRFRAAGWRIVPTDVRWQGELAQVPPKAPCKSLRSDLQKVRRGGFVVEHTTDPAAWAEFAATMVHPTARVRFGSDGWVPSPALLRRFARRGVLHLVYREGRAVAGCCSVRHGDRVWVPLLGVLNGDPGLIQAGAANAALRMTYAWALAQGCHRADAGRSSPFLGDGIARKKAQWGLRPVPDPLVGVAAVWAGSDAARDALARRPVLVETEEGLAPWDGR